MFTLTDEELLAYLDGRLPPERRQEIARQAERDPELADELALIADLTRAAGEAHRKLVLEPRTNELGRQSVDLAEQAAATSTPDEMKRTTEGNDSFVFSGIPSGRAVSSVFAPHGHDMGGSWLRTLRNTFEGREEELRQLTEAWESRTTPVISVVAGPGYGKTALVSEWLRRLGSETMRVFAWSFYCQGTSDRTSSADLFIHSGLRSFGDEDPASGSPWAKAERLARLVKDQPTLLLLDGLEPLQIRSGSEKGRLKDPAMEVLLLQLLSNNPGMCVISTQLAIKELKHFEGRTARQVALLRLPPHAGAQLLRSLGVEGTTAELQQAAEEFGGHCLALTLLGSYLSTVWGGDVKRRSAIGPLEEAEDVGGHARRVLAVYEKWLGRSPEAAVLHMLGLFDRPADGRALASLRAAEIPGLTDLLRPLDNAGWQRVLTRLRHLRLVLGPDPMNPDAVDTHQLVREYFGRKLRQENFDVWQRGHHCLFEHFATRPPTEFPDTLEDLDPLYTAVAHGCSAGRHREALVEVYQRRIVRGKQYFSTRRLGAFGADLAALSGFFEQPWHRPVTALSDAEKGFVLNMAGFRLWALGRLTEAVLPTQEALRTHIALSDWTAAAEDAGNLSELHMVLGTPSSSDTPSGLTLAEDYARQAVDLAERAGQSLDLVNKMAKVAYALHQLGHTEEAGRKFREAEELQRGLLPKRPLLYRYHGCLYLDFLIDRGRYQEVQTRAEQTLSWVIDDPGAPLLVIALSYLAMGRACLLQAREAGGTDLTAAANFLQQATDTLRQAGQQDELLRGLLAQSELRRAQNDWEGARASLDEALSIAERCGSGLYQVDCRLSLARWLMEYGRASEARQDLEKTRHMILEMDYHRRDQEIAELERLLCADMP